MEGFGTKSTLKAETKGDADCKCWDYNLIREDIQAVDILNKTTTLDDKDHYEMGLLWRREQQPQGLGFYTDRALGVWWRIESDMFGIKVLEFKKDNTTRGVLSTICSVFNPLNLPAPVMFPEKQIL